MLVKVIADDTGVDDDEVSSNEVGIFFSSLRQIRYLLGVVFALVVADGVLSNFIISQGLGRESNPLLKTLVGQDIFLLIKVLGALLSVLILWDIYKRWPRLAVVSSICIVTLYTGIVYWNILAFVVYHI